MFRCRWILLAMCLTRIHPSAEDQDPELIRPSRGEAVERAAGSPLSAPFRVEGMKDRLVSVDLGDRDPASNPELATLTLIQGGRALTGKARKFESRCAEPCEGMTAVCYFAGLYRISGSLGDGPAIAIPGNLELKRVTPVSDPKSLGFEIIPEGDEMRLLHRGEPVLSAGADYNEPKLILHSSFALKGKTYYVLTAGLKLEDTTGLLFQDGGQWHFLYRTIAPSERQTICDG